MDKVQQKHYIKDEVIREEKKKYYDNPNIKWEILKVCKSREVVIMSESNNRMITRGWRIDTTPWLDQIVKYRDLVTHDYSFYISCAKYSFIPVFTNKLSERSSQTSEWFKNQAEKSLIAYDVFFDFDSHKVLYKETLKEEVLVLSKFLKESCINYEVFNSKSGFHLIIDNNVLQREQTKELVTLLSKFLKLESICTIGNGNLSKIRKMPFTYIGDTGIKVKLRMSNTENSRIKHHDSLCKLYRMLIENKWVGENE